MIQGIRRESRTKTDGFSQIFADFRRFSQILRATLDNSRLYDISRTKSSSPEYYVAIHPSALSTFVYLTEGLFADLAVRSSSPRAHPSRGSSALPRPCIMYRFIIKRGAIQVRVWSIGRHFERKHDYFSHEQRKKLLSDSTTELFIPVRFLFSLE